MTGTTSAVRATAAGERAAPVTALAGTGRLHTAVRAALRTAGHTTVPATASHGASALVVVADTERVAAPAAPDVPWLPVRVDTGWVCAGPLVRPGRAGCPTCAERRRAVNRPDAAGRRALRERYGAEVTARPNTLLTPLITATVAALVTDDIDRLRHDAAPPRTEGAVLRVRLTDGRTSRHLLLPDPLCPDCGRLPDDRPGAGRPEPRPVRPARPGGLRVRELTGLEAELTGRYVDAETGVVQSLADGPDGGAVAAVARFRPALATRAGQHGYGRAADHAAARLTALTEALERLAGIRPRGRRTAVRAAFADVADTALDPRALGEYPDDWYDRPGAPFARFDPDRPVPWVWGWSFAQGRPLLVPEAYAYYGPRPAAERAHLYETSNGCALGGSLTEAILHGLLEVAERDAFLTTWYARLPAPRVDLDAAADRRVPVTAEHIGQRLGYEVTAFDTTLEQGVPALWVVAVDRARGAGGRPALMCAAGAHPDPERALLGALVELGPALAGLLRRYDATAAARLVADADAVHGMDDHALLYGHPDAARRLGFLPFDGPAHPPARRAIRTDPGDIGAGLADLVGRYLRTGLDVIAVDTTASEHRAGGFRSAKVIVPGTASMTFGHRHRRVHGLPRLLSAPRRLGHADRDLTPGELNPHPHPFP
ncbi:TOMM precursor leader peptide-binding protein [Streptomyces sp. RFCAC02]|uniref:TOMM precursor leader peptide-binding protein n=1 Tax=Streptomyces sp. RFCAC02 TaxID=2499143 RepID=UPI00101FFB0A|nr:TOMM precursor leader peptide-binding protein [Streptomyces sp. RFCAC02]